MKTAIYARVSSERQDIDLSIAAQLKALRNYALSHGHEVVKEYIDEAESGRSIDRPGFREMIATVHQKSSLFPYMNYDNILLPFVFGVLGVQ